MAQLQHCLQQADVTVTAAEQRADAAVGSIPNDALNGFPNEERAQVVSTISRGRLVWHEGALHVEPGTGRFIHLPSGGRLFEGLDTRAAAPYPAMREMQARHGFKTIRDDAAADDRHAAMRDAPERVIREEL